MFGRIGGGTFRSTLFGQFLGAWLRSRRSGWSNNNNNSVRPSYSTRRTSGNTSLNGIRNIDPQTQRVAELKAQIQAQRGRCFHPGGSFGRGRAEGVGAGMTREQAISNCCDFRGPILGQACVQGRNGMWYACTIYA